MGSPCTWHDDPGLGCTTATLMFICTSAARVGSLYSIVPCWLPKMPAKAVAKSMNDLSMKDTRMNALPPKGRCGRFYKRRNGTVVEYKGSRYLAGEPRTRPPGLKKTIEDRDKTIRDLRLDNEQLKKDCASQSKTIDTYHALLSQRPLILTMQAIDEKVERILGAMKVLDDSRARAEVLQGESVTPKATLAERTTTTEQLIAQMLAGGRTLEMGELSRLVLPS